MRLAPVLVGATLALAGRLAWGYAFGVSPIRVDLGPGARSGAISVSNEDRIALSFQMKLLRWTQDAKGEDVYEDSKDLVFFPRLMSVEPAQKRVIRVGTQAPPGPSERAYRLAIEEITPLSAEGGGDSDSKAVAVRMRFAVPVFVAPLAPATKVEIEQLTVSGEQVSFALANTGNVHVRVEKAALRRGEQVLQEVAGWYILPGARRAFTLAVPASECARPGKLALVLKGEGVELERELTVDPARCRR